MKYSPVIITALSRKKYLRRVLVSLAANTGADKTDLFISVDSPPSSKYENGYHDVCCFLHTFDFSGFKSIDITYQKENLGPSNNMRFLYDKVRKISNRVIISEEDNEFSPNFLEYVNKCLEIYETDQNVLAVCGSNTGEVLPADEEIIFSKSLSPYGIGIWFHKLFYLEKQGQADLLNPKMWTFRNMLHLYQKNRILFGKYICDIICKDYGLYWLNNESLNWVDSLFSIYMHITDCVCVVPCVMKSRTWGNDGSGFSGMNYKFEILELDDRVGFDLNEKKDIVFDTCNFKKIENFLIRTGIKNKTIQAIVSYILLLIFTKNREKTIDIIKKIQKHIKNKEIK